MTNKQFAIGLIIVAAIASIYAYFIIPGNFPTGAGGKLHLRDELIRLSEP